MDNMSWGLVSVYGRRGTCQVIADQSDRKTVGMYDKGQSILTSCDHRGRTIQGLD